MPPPSALSKMALWLRYWILADNYRSIKADLYNIEETGKKRLFIPYKTVAINSFVKTITNMCMKYWLTA